MITKEMFAETNWKMSYEEYQKCDCTECKKEECPHRGTYRRVPEVKDFMLEFIVMNGDYLIPMAKLKKLLMMQKKNI